jgi:hypothetical protein
MFVTDATSAHPEAPSDRGSDFTDARSHELEHLPLERLEHEISQLASHINAGICRWLELVAEFDRREGWGSWGCRSCAEWISWRCAVDPRTAREHVRVARCLPQLPQIRAAFARGELSYTKVRALTRVAGADSDAELLEVAHHATAAQLERIVRAYRRVTSRDANEAHEDRSLTWFWEQDGSLFIHGQLSAEDGALFLRAVEAAREELWKQTEGGRGGSAEPQSDDARTTGGSAEPGPEPRQTNADALVRVAENSLASESGQSSGGDRTQVVVHIDAATLTKDEHRRCELEDGVAIAPETARRLACDSSLVSILESGEETLSVGRKRRSIPPALRTALQSRDRTCRFPGCEHSRFTDAHHLQHWARGGETTLDNLLLLCRHHHRLVHEGAFSIEPLADGDVRFRRADGSVLDAVTNAPPGDARALSGLDRRQRLAAD